MWKKIISKIKYWSPVYRVRCFFNPYNVVKIKTLPQTWVDKDEKLLHAAFSILVDFVENEIPGSYVDWNHSKRAKQEYRAILKLYSWWKTRKDDPAPKELQKVTSEIYHLHGWWPEASPIPDSVHKMFLQREWEYEKEARKQDTKNLARLCKLRDRLWT